MKNRLARLALVSAAALSLSGCFALPQMAPAPSAPTATTAPTAPTTPPVAPDPSDPPAAPIGEQQVTPTNPQVYTVNGDGSSFSFEPVGASVVAGDSYGDAASAGNQLVLFTMNVDCLSGSGGFLYTGSLYLVDASGHQYDTSTALSYIAEHDYYLTEQNIGQGVQAIFMVPQNTPITHWVYETHEGQSIDIQMQ